MTSSASRSAKSSLHGYFSRSSRKIPIRCNKAQTGIILRNCIRNKTKPLTTKLARTVPIHPKLFHVEQFVSPPCGIRSNHRHPRRAKQPSPFAQQHFPFAQAHFPRREKAFQRENGHSCPLPKRPKSSGSHPRSLPSPQKLLHVELRRITYKKRTIEIDQIAFVFLSVIPAGNLLFHVQK